MARVEMNSPVGALAIEADDTALTAIHWIDHPRDGGEISSPLLAEARRQVAAYFAGTLRAFDLPVAPAGSAFEHRVWELMCRIPYGGTMTYGEMAAALGGDPRNGGGRAIGAACGSNPIPIVIPCHRVMAAGGRMGGFSGRGGVHT